MSSSEVKEQPESPESVVAQIIRLYGDLIFDLCVSALRNPAGAQIAFRAIIKDLGATGKENAYHDHQRAWALRVAIEHVKILESKHRNRLSPDELIALDSETDLDRRLERFEQYFQRLPIDDQIILLLRDKYGIPYPEIASAVSMPEGSIQVQRRQALRALEDSIWGAR